MYFGLSNAKVTCYRKTFGKFHFFRKAIKISRR